MNDPPNLTLRRILRVARLRRVRHGVCVRAVRACVFFFLFSRTLLNPVCKRARAPGHLHPRELEPRPHQRPGLVHQKRLVPEAPLKEAVGRRARRPAHRARVPLPVVRAEPVPVEQLHHRRVVLLVERPALLAVLKVQLHGQLRHAAQQRRAVRQHLVEAAPLASLAVQLHHVEAFLVRQVRHGHEPVQRVHLVPHRRVLRRVHPALVRQPRLVEREPLRQHRRVPVRERHERVERRHAAPLLLHHVEVELHVRQLAGTHRQHRAPLAEEGCVGAEHLRVLLAAHLFAGRAEGGGGGEGVEQETTHRGHDTLLQGSLAQRDARRRRRQEDDGCRSGEQHDASWDGHPSFTPPPRPPPPLLFPPSFLASLSLSTVFFFCLSDQ
eukprot:Rhum_TRINITY_DN12630_c1_g2::Rhum_TRINITY_DN12630_c1_g2_i1::g.53070::m.53070